MISFGSIRMIFGALSRQQPMFRKRLIKKTNNQLLFLHSSKVLWDGHAIEIKMPALSPTMTEGTIVKWLKKEGDTISPGDVLCEIQTDKAVVALETEEEGVLEKILVPEDTKNVQLGEIIAIITGEGEATTSVPVVPPVESSKVIKKPHVESDSIRLVGPSVKKLLEEYRIKFSDISFTGPHHNLLKGDVLNYIRDHNLKPPPKDTEKLKPKKSPITKTGPKGTYSDIPLSTSEATAAQELIQSKTTIPHGYMSTDCKIDKVFDYEEKFRKDGIDVSLNEFVIKSAVVALKRVPKLNTIRHNGQIKSANSVNISITDFDNGNYATTIIKNAESLSIQLISEYVKASQAKESNLETMNGMFRISTLAKFGISEFSEVISPTDVAVMAIGGVRQVFEGNRLVKKLKVTLSFDNYIIGEDEAGEFLETFKHCLENPLNIACLG